MRASLASPIQVLARKSQQIRFNLKDRFEFFLNASLAKSQHGVNMGDCVLSNNAKDYSQT